jgi:hypothetical protein
MYVRVCVWVETWKENGVGGSYGISLVAFPQHQPSRNLINQELVI